jgi:bifunctional DNase/RNase
MMFHSLLSSISILGGTLESVLIDVFDEANRAYHAKLRLLQNEAMQHCDMRPSDALTTGVIADVPLFISEDVLSRIERLYKTTGHSMRLDS